MILTITLNPLLERRFLYSSIQFGKENRNGIKKLKAGGKGINVSRQLNYLQTQNMAFTFLGGNNGKILKDILSAGGINFTSIKTKTETREASVVIDQSNNSLNTFFSENQKINDAEVEEFKKKLEKMIMNCEIVVFSGSSPCKNASSIFSFGIQTANKYSKISICDTYGNHLSDCINSSPTIIHNNIPETEKSLNISLKSEEEKINYLDLLYKKNIKQVFLTDGKYPTYASNFDFKFKVENLKIKTIDPTGSGDSFTAGIAYSWHKNLTFDEMLRISSALGNLNAQSFEISSVPFDQMEKIKDQFEVYSIGKKMKKIDVTPQ